jgi:hypothetical protein
MDYTIEYYRIKSQLLKLFFASVFIIQGISLFSCVDKIPYRKDVKTSLHLAGSNRSELVKVIEYYRQDLDDTLKLRAACYLISNMKGHFASIKIDSVPFVINKSFEFVDSLSKTTYFTNKNDSLFSFAEFMHKSLDTYDYSPTSEYIDSLIKIHYSAHQNYSSLKDQTFRYESEIKKISDKLLEEVTNLEQKTGMFFDIENIKADWLISHIDNAFKVWNESPYARNLSYNEFTQTLLPYRSFNEALDVSSEFCYNYFYDIIHSEDSLNLAEAIRRFNFYIFSIDCFEDEGRNLGNLGIYDVLQFYKYECDRHAEWTNRVLNACGVPTHLDFTSSFFNRNKSHYAVTVRDTSGKYRPFTPKWQMLDDDTSIDKCKVFRRTYEIQKCPFTLKKENEEVPKIFNSPFIMDVTDEYHDVTDLTLPVNNTHKNKALGYLGIFTPVGWKPVAWGIINKSKRNITFKKVPIDAVYICGYLEKNEFVPYSAPFYLNNTGKPIEIKPDSEKVDLQLTRKYYIKERMLNFAREMVGTIIQVANMSDFSDAVNLYTLNPEDLSNLRLITIDVNCKKKFRYIRCYAKPGKSLNISIFEIFKDAELDEIEVKGSQPFILSKDELNSNNISHLTKVKVLPLSNQNFENAFDGNMVTFVNTFVFELDLGSPIEIKQVRIAPRNADNHVVVGDRYELLYYDDAWTSAGIIKAKYNFLEYKNVPSNTIYWLKNLDRGKEEHAFIYWDGKQIFVNHDSFVSIYE